MVYKLVRVGILAMIFLLVITPVLVAWSDNFSLMPDFSNRVSTFLTYTGSFFQNVHGLINQFLYRGFGDLGIRTFNLLIHISLIMPVFGLSARIIVFIRRELS